MRIKRIVAFVLTIVIMSSMSVTTFAQEKLYFLSFTGTVKKIEDHWSMENAKFISLEDDEGNPANAIISDTTYIAGDKDIEVGDVITVYYDANKPMIMIYPPQYSAEVVVVHGIDLNVEVDYFNKELVNSDNTLKLNISDETKVLLQNGEEYKGKLEDKKLVVFYGASTKSIPAQTNPDKVVVLMEDVASMAIVVNGDILEAPSAYMNDEGTVMVPIRAISEALGYEVLWEQKTKSVTLSNAISLFIGKDYYTYMKMAPIELGTAPELINSRTFVPLSFFTEVVKVKEAGIIGGSIIINQ